MTDSNANTSQQFRPGFDSRSNRATNRSECRTKFRGTFDATEFRPAFASSTTGASARPFQPTHSVKEVN